MATEHPAAGREPSGSDAATAALSTVAAPPFPVDSSSSTTLSRPALSIQPLTEVWLVAALMVLAALIRWVNLWSIPIFTDEGDEIGLALRIVRDGARPLTNDDPYLGPLFNYLLAGLFWIAGPNPWLPRLLMLGLGTLTVVAAYLLGRELALAAGGDRRQAMLGGAIGALLLAVNPEHVLVNSHVAWGNCVTPLFTTTALCLLVRALRLGEEAAAAPGRAAGLLLVLAGMAFGLAFQTHPMAAAFLPGVALFAVWRARFWLRTSWPYLAALAFVAAQLPTLLFMAREGPARWLAAVREKQTMYEGTDSVGAGTVVERLGALLHTLGASLGGLIDDRDTPMPAPWHLGLLLAVILAVLALAWLWRRAQPLCALVVISNLMLLPLVNGKFTPLISNSRYVMPVAIVVLAAIGAWAACSLPTAYRLLPTRLLPTRLLPTRLLATLALGLLAVASLVSFSVEAAWDGRTNDRLLASLAALEAAYQPGDVVVVDRAMYRDWTLTEGRLQRVFSSWLDTRGLPSRVVDIDENGRVRADLAERGGLLVLAQRTVPAVERAYRLETIASDAAPGAPAGSGYRIVRARRSEPR